MNGFPFTISQHATLTQTDREIARYALIRFVLSSANHSTLIAYYLQYCTTKTNFSEILFFNPLIHFIIFHFQFDLLLLSLPIDLTLAGF